MFVAGLRFVAVSVVGLYLAGCSMAPTLSLPDVPKIFKSKKKSKQSSALDPFAGIGSPYYKGKKLPKGGGKYHVGKPYQVAGKWYTPKEDPKYDKVGMASWYGEAFNRRKTSNGEYFDMNDMTAAHPTLPLPSYAKVTNTSNGRTIIVRINDRGPFVGTRVIDMSKRSAQALGFIEQGKTEVRVQWIGPAPLDHDGKHLIAMNSRLGRGESIASLRRDNGNNISIASLKAKKAKVAVAALEDDFMEPAQTTFMIQVATFRKRKNALAARDDLSAFGPVQIAEVEDQDRVKYRIQVGPFKSSIAAEQAFADIRDNGFPDAKLGFATIQQASAQP